MPISSNQILRVVAKMSIDGGDVQNTYHLRVTVSSDPGDTTTVSEIAAWLDTAYGYVSANFPNQLTYDSIQVWNESSNTFLGETTWPTETIGGYAGNSLPYQTAALCLFNTNVNRSQGRKFLPPIGAGAVDDNGTPATATLAAIGNYIASIMAGVSGTGWSGEPGNWNVDLVRFVPWVYGIARDIYATQRRRYIGKGS